MKRGNAATGTAQIYTSGEQSAHDVYIIHRVESTVPEEGHRYTRIIQNI